MDIRVIREKGEISPVYYNIDRCEFDRQTTEKGTMNVLCIFSTVNNSTRKLTFYSKGKIEVEEHCPTMGEIFKGLWSELKEFGCIIWGWIKRIPGKCTRRRFK